MLYSQIEFVGGHEITSSDTRVSLTDTTRILLPKGQCDGYYNSTQECRDLWSRQRPVSVFGPFTTHRSHESPDQSVTSIETRAIVMGRGRESPRNVDSLHKHHPRNDGIKKRNRVHC